MIESGKENLFIREKCEKCLNQIVDSMIGTNIKLVLCFGQHLKSKNVVKRMLGSRYLNVIQETFGVEKCLSGKELTGKVMRGVKYEKLKIMVKTGAAFF